tara:strand:- start:4835 stop:6343 length:1509 start_codon:yes stop_codon:yes gene_type:complete
MNKRELSVDIINKLFDTYKDDKLQSKIYNYISNNLVNILLKLHDDEIEKKNLSIKINDFIEDFFLEDNSYFYVQHNDTYIYYNDVKYQIIDEDEIILKLYDLIKEEQDIKYHKQKISRDILKMMKEHKLEKSIPESTTITYLNTFFIPNLLSMKTDMKYLYCIIGDSILHKKTNNIFYFNIESKDFFEILNDLFQYYFGMHLSLNIKYKYHTEHEYNLCRILNFNIAVKNRDFWETFLKDNIFNIYVVSCYYSIRYGNSESYLKTLSPTNKNNILFLKNNNKSKIINMFINKMLVQEEEKKINLNNMYFLWKIFTKQQNIPNVMYKTAFYKLLENSGVKECEKHFTGYSSEYLSNIKYFQHFWNDTMVENNGDELEINELYLIYREWCTNKGYNNVEFGEDKMYDLINYFYSEVDIKDNKFILNKTNILWDKHSFIEIGLEEKFKKQIEHKISLNKLYKYYCSYCKVKNEKIASKNYFINTIHRIIPENYIMDNKILSNYWI